MLKKKTLMSWSSGKDSAWALYKLLQNPEIAVVGLFCTINREFNRVAMHGVSVELLLQQAERIGLPIELIEIPYPCSNDEYEKIMEKFVAKALDNNNWGQRIIGVSVIFISSSVYLLSFL